MLYRYFLYHPDLKQPVKLKYAPKGWDTLDKEFKRNASLLGVFVEFTEKISFVKDGKAIVQSLYELYGPEAEIQFWIDKKNMTTRLWERDYTGRLNLLTLRITVIEAECNVENTGFFQKFKNRMDVKVNLQSLVNLDNKAIPAFTDEVQPVTLHSKEIKLLDHFNRDPDGVDLIWADNLDPGASKFVSTELQTLSEEFGEIQIYNDAISTIDPVATDLYTIKILPEATGVCSFDMKFRVKQRARTTGIVGGTSPVTLNLVIKHKKAIDGSVTDYIHNVVPVQTFANGSWFDSGWVDVVYTPSFAVEKNDLIFYFWEFGHAAAGVSNNNEFYFDLSADNYIKIEMLSNFPVTDTSMVMVHEAYARICQATLGRDDAFRSTYYGRTDSEPVTYADDGAGSLRGFLSGFWARKFPIAEKPMNMSFNDLFKHCQATDGVGVGIEMISGREYVVVEKLDYFFKAEEVIRLNFVKDIEKEVAEDYYYNEWEISFKKWTSAIKSINSLDEFNTKREGVTPITQVKKKLSLLSPFIAGGYPLEQTRRDQYTVAKTRDNENDNETFALQLRRSGGDFVPAKDEDYDSITGVISSSTIYNADLSPMRCLRRNGRMIRSFLEKQKTQSLRVTFSEGNSQMVSKRSDEATAINESADVVINTLDKPLYLPEIYRFKSPLTIPQMDAMTANPHGYISFSSTDKNHKRMFLLNAKRDAKTRLVTFIGLKANL